MKNIIILGATSGIGFETAKLFLQKGYNVGVCGRRTERLDVLKTEFPDSCYIQKIDILNEDATTQLDQLIKRMGGLDIYLHSSGVGQQNKDLDCQTEINTANTNIIGFTRLITHVFNYFKSCNNGGHISIISSIAGTKGIGIAPSYSATKRFQNTYIEALEQLSRTLSLNISFTDIRPGFVDTDLLANKSYPMLMKVDKTAVSVVSAIEKRKRIAVINRKFKLLVMFWQMIPKSIWVRIKL